MHARIIYVGASAKALGDGYNVGNKIMFTALRVLQQMHTQKLATVFKL